MDDMSIKRLVENELEWEASLDAADIGVLVEHGVVTLNGHVSKYVEKVTAEQVAKRLKSVRGVVNRLEVRPAGVLDGDEDIARRAANLVEWDVTIPEGAVKVAVSKGFVTLSGEVPWHYQRTAAEHAVRRLNGVTGVSNQIAVKPHVQAADIKRRIEEALDRQADIEAARIRVSVEGDKVRLEGSVRAWFERNAIEEAAWSAPGVRQVDDRVTVGP